MKPNCVSRRLGVLACAMLVVALTVLAGCGQGATGSSSDASQGSQSAASSTTASGESASSEADNVSSSADLKKAQAEGPYASGLHHATLTVKGYDPIRIELDADAAPASVANFCALANDGYYDGKTFYRFATGFCMQGGTAGNSPSGSDSSLSPIVGEFSQNGYDNALADDFKRGTVAMARTTDPDSATSTFFVTLDSSEMIGLSLNGQYAAFGTIDKAGMDIVDKIVDDHLEFVSDPNMGTISDEANQAVITSIKVND